MALRTFHVEVSFDSPFSGERFEDEENLRATSEKTAAAIALRAFPRSMNASVDRVEEVNKATPKVEKVG